VSGTDSNSKKHETAYVMLQCHEERRTSAGPEYSYGAATISRLLKIIGLFCTRALQKRLYSAKETYDLKEPASRSHPIPE